MVCTGNFASPPPPRALRLKMQNEKEFSPFLTYLARVQEGKDGELEIDEPRDLFTQENFQKFSCDWEKKQKTAFFRRGNIARKK